MVVFIVYFSFFNLQPTQLSILICHDLIDDLKLYVTYLFQQYVFMNYCRKSDSEYVRVKLRVWSRCAGWVTGL